LSRLLLLISSILLISCTAFGQENVALPDTADSPKTDTLFPAVSMNPRTYSELPLDSVPYQNPTVALFKSMLVPGLGQIGNKSYIKAGIAIVSESIFIGAIVHWAKKTRDAKAAFDAVDPDSVDIRGTLYNTYSDYKDKRNFYSWMLGTAVFLSMFDAYVDAHLRQFPAFRNRDEGLSWEIGPADKPESFALKIAWNF